MYKNPDEQPQFTIDERCEIEDIVQLWTTQYKDIFKCLSNNIFQMG